MKIGIPKERKSQEERVSITPAGVDSLAREGHQVLLENHAGAGSGFGNESYEQAGARIIDGPEEIFESADMILKVKEPLDPECDLFRENQILFTYLHLAAVPAIAGKLLERNVTGIAYETVQRPDGSLPLLTPMSEVAGRMSVQIASRLLEKHFGGKGILMSGVPGTPPAKVVIVGGGIVGANAAGMALGLRANVTVLDINLERLRYLADRYGERLTTLYSSPSAIREQVKEADVVIGAVLIPGKKAPCLVTEEMVKAMQPGSVVVDVAIDQGGSIETIDRVTTHENPSYIKHGVVHYSVANMPGAVPRTATMALTNATLPYVVELANKGLRRAADENESLKLGINTLHGGVVHKEVAISLGLPCENIDELL